MSNKSIWDTFEVYTSKTGRRTVKFETKKGDAVLVMDTNDNALERAKAVCAKYPNDVELLCQKGEIIKCLLIG